MAVMMLLPWSGPALPRSPVLRSPVLRPPVLRWSGRRSRRRGWRGARRSPGPRRPRSAPGGGAPASLDQRDPVAEPLGLVGVVGDEQHRDAVVAQFLHQPPAFTPGGG